MGVDTDDDSAELEFDPPPTHRVAARALVLAAVACRSLIETDAGKDGVEALRARILPWLVDLGIADELEDAERALIETPVGKLDNRARVNGSWRAEGVVVLAWALRYCDLPSYEVECDPSGVANGMGFLADRAETPLAAGRLRAPEEIEHWANTYLTLHWRLRQFMLEPKAMDFPAFAASCRWGPLTVVELGLAEGDLAIGGQRIDGACERAIRTTLSIVQERHLAFNWLLGWEPVYSEVPTDT